ncbi:MAG: haloacid dehalogenase type II [Acidiferrobacterales bacterium]|nr:haloacid dehalogenase type II [Acidiferrobacterales bacterium]
MPDSIIAVMFDVFGTVVDWRSSIANEVKCVPGLESVDGHEFADSWRGKYQPAMERIRTGERPWTKLDDLHRENLTEVLEDLGIGTLSHAQMDDLNRAWHRLRPWPDAAEGLHRLKKRYIIATLSNGNVSLIVNMAKHSGLPWDMVLGAEVVRHYKPQPEAYLKSAEMLDLQPHECMLVAAHNSDLVAASRCGFKTAFVARPTEHGPDQDFDLNATGDYDVTARDFLELADRLGA